MSSAEGAKEAGNAAWKSGDHDTAIQCFTRAIKLAEDEDSDHELLHIYYSNRSAAKGAHAAALLDAEKTVELKPTFAKGWGRKGAALLGLNRRRDAIEAYTEGLRLDSSNADLRRGLQIASRPQSGPSTSSTASAGQGHSGGNLLVFVQKNKFITVRFMLHTVVIGGFMLFMLPFISGRIAFYKRLTYGLCCTLIRALLANLVVKIASLYMNHGRPQFNAEYGAKILADSNTLQLIPSLILLFQRPYLFGIAPIVSTTLVPWLWVFCCMLQVYDPTKLGYLDNIINRYPAVVGNLSYWRNLSANDRWTKATQSSDILASKLEVAFSLLLVVELLFPRRNFLMTILWWQQIRVRCMLEIFLKERGQVPYLRQAFGLLDSYILGRMNHPRCPSLMRTGYGKIRETAIGMVKLPDPNAAGAGAMTSCSIM